jgi:hypothetical protein
VDWNTEDDYSLIVWVVDLPAVIWAMQKSHGPRWRLFDQPSVLKCGETIIPLSLLVVANERMDGVLFLGDVDGRESLAVPARWVGAAVDQDAYQVGVIEKGS